MPVEPDTWPLPHAPVAGNIDGPTTPAAEDDAGHDLTPAPGLVTPPAGNGAAAITGILSTTQEAIASAESAQDSAAGPLPTPASTSAASTALFPAESGDLGTTSQQIATTDPGAAQVVLARIDQQATWFDQHAKRSRIAYCGIKLVQIMLGASVPVTAAGQSTSGLSPFLTGTLGGLIVVLEGVQQLFQFHASWLRYRQACTTLQTERQLFLAGAGDYASSAAPVPLLAIRVEGIVGQELTGWAKTAQGQAATT